MKFCNTFIILSACMLFFFSCRVMYNSSANLNTINWIHGSANCNENTDPPVQIVQFNYNTFILRQNKCLNFEGPFMFLFLGKKKALLMDTGATEDEDKFPLYITVRKLINEWEKKNGSVELIVAHTHGHGDHHAGDKQFRDKPNTVVVGLGVADVQSFFKIENWPLENATVDLGGRLLDIIPIPGHQKASIALYDRATKLLLPGDSFYPGRLYVEDWQAYKASIQRLTDFAETHKISYILGNHIEMTKTPGKDYPIHTTFQPEEHILPLTVKELRSLNEALKKAERPVREVHDSFIIWPD